MLKNWSEAKNYVKPQTKQTDYPESKNLELRVTILGDVNRSSYVEFSSSKQRQIT